MYKNIAIALLACCCLYLAVAQRMERNAWEERPIGAAVYGGLVALRDVLPPEVYREQVLPFLERAAAEGHATYGQLRQLNDILHDVGRQALDAAAKTRPQEALNEAWENAKRGASNLGGEVGRNMRDALDQMGRMLDEATRREPAPRAPAPRPAEPSAPAQI